MSNVALTSTSRCGCALGSVSIEDNGRSCAAGNVGLTFVKGFLNGDSDGRTDVPGVPRNCIPTYYGNSSIIIIQHLTHTV